VRRNFAGIAGVLAVVALLALGSCQQVVETVGKTTFSYALRGAVLDQSGAPIAGAVVTLDTPDGVFTTIDETTTTKGAARTLTNFVASSDGTYRITGLAQGSYKVTVAPPLATPGFAVYETTLSVAAGVTTVDFTLPALGGTVNGVLTKDIAVYPALVVPSTNVRTALNNNYYLPVVGTSAVTKGSHYLTTTTGADGAFSFTGVPFGGYSSPTLYYEVTSGATATTWSARIASSYNLGTLGGVVYGTTYEAGVLAASSLNSSLDLLTSPNGRTVAVAANLVSTFNNPLTQDYINTIHLYQGTTSNPVGSTVTINGNTLTIDPTVDLDPGTRYGITGQVSDGVTTYELSMSFSTATATGSVTAPVIALASPGASYNSGATTVTLTNTAYDSSITYELFTKLSSSDEWVKGSSGDLVTTPTSGTSATQVATASVELVSGKSLQFKLRASKEVNGTTEYADSNVVSIADTVVPATITSSRTTSAPLTSAGTKTQLYTVSLANSEVFRSIQSSASSSGVTVGTITYDATMTEAYIPVTVAAGTTSGSITLALVDGAGNAGSAILTLY